MNKYPSYPILAIDDEIHLLHAYELTLEFAGLNNTIICEDSRNAENILNENIVSLVLLDLSMPHISGEQLLEKIKENYPHIPVIIITGDNDVETAVECMKKGAFDFIIKPINEERLLSSVNKALEISELKNENTLLKEKFLSNDIEFPEAFTHIITQNADMKNMFQYMEAISNTSEPILIEGETGVGKELVANAIHKLSKKEGNFVTINVAGLDDHMFTDTLFGHIKGAFTGAELNRPGLIEKANNGTLFLDEIGELSLPSQVKLLRLLQEHEYYPLGIDDPSYSNALIIVATNQDIFKLQEDGSFRRDLFYRLNVHKISPIPLRQRKDDLPLLMDFFLTEAARDLQKKKPTPPPELLDLLSTYHFPGNIRELKAIIYNAVSTHKKNVLSLETIKTSLQEKVEAETTIENNISKEIKYSSLLPTLKESQNLLIEEALNRANNNQSIAAQLLGITRQALNKRLKSKD